MHFRPFFEGRVCFVRLLLLNNMFVEIIHVRINANFAEQVDGLQSGLLPDRQYANGLQNVRDLPVVQQNGGNDVGTSKPNRLL